MTLDLQKTCLDCLETMPAKARKCQKCGSFQDWRRLTGQSTTTFSLLIALITVSTFAFETWRGRNPTTGFEAFTRVEQSEDLLDFVNTGEVALRVNSIRMELKFSEEIDLPSIPGEPLSEDNILSINTILENISLRTVGILHASDSKSLRIEYVPGTDYSDVVFLISAEPDYFANVIQRLDWQAEGLPAFDRQVLCQYVITYAFISAYAPTGEKTKTVNANCKSIGQIGQQHMEHICAKESEACDAAQINRSE